MSTAKVENPDDIKCTLKFTMSLGDWKQINTTLGKHSAYIELQIIDEIRDLVNQLEQTFYNDTGT